MLIVLPWKPPVWCKSCGHNCYICRVMGNVVRKFPNFRSKIPKFRSHGNKGRSRKSFLSEPYAEAMFQIWWRSVHKWRHNLFHRCRTPVIVHAKWSCIISHAAMHCIGQTISVRMMLTLSSFFIVNLELIVSNLELITFHSYLKMTVITHTRQCPNDYIIFSVFSTLECVQYRS